MYPVYRNQATAAYLSLYFFTFLSQFFIPLFSGTVRLRRNCEAFKVETWYTRGQWADVSCILESGYCYLFVPLFIFLSLSFHFFPFLQFSVHNMYNFSDRAIAGLLSDPLTVLVNFYLYSLVF